MIAAWAIGGFCVVVLAASVWGLWKITRVSPEARKRYLTDEDE